MWRKLVPAVAALLLVALALIPVAHAQQPPPPPPPQSPRVPPGPPPPPLQDVEIDSSPTYVLWILGGLAVLAIVALVLGRRHDGGSRPSVGSVAPSRTPEEFDELLEVGRRLTAATATGDIERAVVREAIGLVRANAAALVRQEGERLVIAHESTAELLREEGLSEGVIARVAATGQPVVQVSATEPAIRFLPVSMIAIPLVGAGRVDAVLVLVRGTTTLFTPHERERLTALAPIAAAAMQSARESSERSSIDALTGVGNRGRLDAELPRVLTAAEGRPTSLIMVDLDHFKSVNDEHGHPAGDALLRAVARVLREAVRPTDAVYRYGGEEFCAVLPETDTETAALVAERIRTTIEERSFEVGSDENLRATASLGVASATEPDAESLIAAADRALYEAKRAGRNRVVADP